MINKKKRTTIYLEEVDAMMINELIYNGKLKNKPTTITNLISRAIKMLYNCEKPHLSQLGKLTDNLRSCDTLET